ncbi:MAG: nucleotidyltransferase family protein [Acidobacteria bacterium]|nr:nucleotidyltransferase family protein [Acidobacteriota bacterium]
MTSATIERPVAAVLLAAGASRRFGGTKLVAEVEGTPLVARTSRVLLAAGLSPVRVVLGAWEREVRVALSGIAVELVVNPRWEEGMLSSVSCGLRGLAGSVAVTPADLPFLTAGSVLAVVRASRTHPEAVCVPSFEGRRGHPIVLPPTAVARVLGWPGTARLSDLLRQPDLEVVEVEVADSGGLRDADVPADLFSPPGRETPPARHPNLARFAK